MPAKSYYLDNALLNAILKATGSIPAPTSLYVALNTSASTPSTPGTEVTDTNYARVAVPSWAFGGSNTDSATNTGSALAFFGAGAAAGPYTIVEVALYDSLSGGHELWYGAVSPNVTVNSGDTATINTGTLTLVQGSDVGYGFAQAVLAVLTKASPTSQIPFAYVPPAATNLYCALNTTATSGEIPGNEVFDANYSRQQFTFGSVSNGTVTTTGALNFFGSGAASGPYTLVEAAMYDAPKSMNGSGAALFITGTSVQLTGISGFTAAFVGSPITIVGCSNSNNDGLFIITSYTSPSQIGFTNPNAVGPTDSGSWSVGNELYFGELSSSKTVGQGDTLTIPTGDFTVTES